MRLGRRGPVSESPEHGAEFFIMLHRLQVAREPEAGGTEERRPRFARQPDDLTRVGVTGGERLVNKHALLGGEYGPNLIQVWPPVYALQKHGVYFFAQIFNRTDDLDPPFVLQLGSESVNARPTRFDFWAAAFNRRDDPRAGNVIGVGFVVEQFGEGRHMRRVQANHADLDLLRLRGRLSRRQAKSEKRDEGCDEKCCAEECSHGFFTLISIPGLAARRFPYRDRRSCCRASAGSKRGIGG